MTVRINNKFNIVPAIINIVWSIVILFLFIFRVPEFETQKPEGASMLIFGTILISAFLFIISLIYIAIANFHNKIKIYCDIYFTLIPVIILTAMILLRL